MAHREQAGIAGMELAGEVLHDARQALLAFLVRLEAGDGLELGIWAITGKGTLARPCRPLVFPVRDVDRVRALVERAIAALPYASYGEDTITVLAEDGHLRAGVTCSSDGMGWATLGWADGSGSAAVPAIALESFGRVLAEAERELTELGLVAFPSGLPTR